MKKAKKKARTNGKERTSERISRQHVDKFAARRTELAEVALQTLSELGYARTSLREIAQNTKFSLGVLHYYFADKVELIMHCVRQYKARCVTRYDEIVASATTAAELRRGFALRMLETLREDAPMHRLWYDLRTQSLFEASFRKDVEEIDQSLERMIWRIVSEHARLSKVEPQFTSAFAYALFDGLFQQALLRYFQGDAAGAAALEPDVERALFATLARAPRSAPAAKGRTAKGAAVERGLPERRAITRRVRAS